MPTAILLIATFADFKFKKVQNYLVLLMLALVLAHHLWIGSREVWVDGSMGFAMAIALCLPLYLMKALGGGDLKIFAVFGLATGFSAVLYTFLFSLFWGSFLGIVRSLLSHQGKVFLSNIQKILKLQKPDPTTVQKIPYTIALLLGWFSYVLYAEHGRIL